MTVNHRVAGSSPARGAIGSIVQSGLGLRIVNPATWVQIPLEPPMLTVAQLVEHQFVELDVASSSLVRQPKRRIVQLGRTLALGARGHTFKSCYADQI